MKKFLATRLPEFWAGYILFAFAMLVTIVLARAVQGHTASFAENAVVVGGLVLCGILMQIFYERSQPEAEKRKVRK